MATATSRNFLADFVDARVCVQGFVEKFSVNKNPADPYVVALTQDCVVIANGMQYDLGHTWVQRAEHLQKVVCEGDKAEFTCRVREYRKDGKYEYGLILPEDVKKLPHGSNVSLKVPQEKIMTPPKTATQTPIARPVQNGDVPKATPVDKPLDAVTAIVKVKSLAKELGGMDNLKAIIAALEN